MDKQEFAIGAVVKLRSGGADMTVQGLHKVNGDVIESGAERVTCAYFTDRHEMKMTHPISPVMLDLVSEGPRERAGEDGDKSSTMDPWNADRATPGLGNAGNNSTSGLNRPLSPVLQSQQQDRVHEGDDLPQSLGYEAERQPAQEQEIAHARVTDDPNDDVETVHERTDKGPKPAPATGP